MDNNVKAVLMLMALFLAGCASAPEDDMTAYIGVGAPQHYMVWVEAFELEASGVRHWRMPMGGVGCCWKGPDGPTGKGATAKPFPNYIGIRWFSFAEQKFYERLFSMPEGLEKKMRKHATYTTRLGTFSRPRDMLTIGLTPGGQIVLWINNHIGNEIEVGRLQANEVEGDASRYQERTEEYLKQSGVYIEKHGVPTEGW